MKERGSMLRTNLHSERLSLNTQPEKAKIIRLFLALLVLGLGVFIFTGITIAGETSQENDPSFYSDFSRQNIYNEGINQLDFGRWGRKFFKKPLPSQNVNVFDEVPDSAFFTNRQGRNRLSLEALEKGYQETPGPDLSGALQVLAAEQRGIYPRFWARDARGDDYLLEFDPQGNMELATGAEVVASRFYYALGYTVPQLTILRVRADQLRAAPGAATWEDTGFKKALTQKRLEEYLMVLPQNAEGLYRASSRKRVKGNFLGHFSFESRRKEDPSDRVNHRDRREVRALGIFASWLNHDDLGESDTLDMSVEENGRRVTKHYLANFNGALGSAQEGPKEPMLGYEHILDYGETLKAILALGFHEKAWQKKWRLEGENVQASPAIGYFNSDLFDPAKYKTQFPYEAFRLATRADGFWAAKLLMSFSDEDIRAMVKAGQYREPQDAETLSKILIERRDAIIRGWLSRANPLDAFSLSEGKLTFKDLAVERGAAPGEGTSYCAEVTREGKKEKIAELETKELSFAVRPEWIPQNGRVKFLLRVKRAPSEKPGPAVTVLLNAEGIQEIHHED